MAEAFESIKRMAIFYLLYFLNSLKFAEPQLNLDFLPLKTFESKASFSPNLIGLPKYFSEPYIPKVEHLESEDVYFMSYGVSIIMFKRGNSNIFKMDCIEIENFDLNIDLYVDQVDISFALIKGRDEIFIAERNKREWESKSTKISKYNWRARKKIQDIAEIRDSFTDILHLAGSSLLFLCKKLN